MDIEQLTDDELDAIWGATGEAADMECAIKGAKFRKSCAELGKALMEKIKPIVEACSNLILKFNPPKPSILSHIRKWWVQEEDDDET